ncbi:MAG TPA: diacylglycerol kinase [Pseudolabrys sp.]|jgi:diacylglycerol kinase (ATP)|nr:diacylglycerol kinase [Pseudolabrys sp.]
MRIYEATLNTLRGLACAAKTEAAPRQEMAVLIAALPLGILLAPSVAWYVAMIAALLVTLAVELLNTAIERLADRVTMKRDARIGMVKDFGSAAVFCALCVAGLVWIAAAAIRFGLL